MSGLFQNKLVVFLFASGFIVFNLWIKYVSGEILTQKKDCPCARTWQVEQVNNISTVGLFVGIINIFIPVTRTLYNIPIISTIFTALTVIILLMYVFSLSYVGRQLDEDKCIGCKVPGKPLMTIIGNLDSFPLIVIAAGLGIGLMYF